MKDGPVHAWMSGGDRALVEAAAERRGTTVSGFLRQEAKRAARQELGIRDARDPGEEEGDSE